MTLVASRFSFSLFFLLYISNSNGNINTDFSSCKDPVFQKQKKKQNSKSTEFTKSFFFFKRCIESIPSRARACGPRASPESAAFTSGCAIFPTPRPSSPRRSWSRIRSRSGSRSSMGRLSTATMPVLPLARAQARARLALALALASVDACTPTACQGPVLFAFAPVFRCLFFFICSMSFRFSFLFPS